MAKRSNRPKVLVLYQMDGTKKERPRQRKLLDRFRAEIKNEFDAHELCEEINTTSFENYQTAFENLIQTNNYHCAVAFFFRDQRQPSQAGNVAFEVGYWLGRFGDHRLFALHEEKAGPTDDLGVIPASKFKGAKSAATEFRTFYDSKQL